MSKTTSDHVARYIRRLNNKLAGLNALERHALLVREQAKWLNRYQAFAAKMDADDDAEPPKGVSAFDYIQTLCAINKHLMEHL